MNTIRFISRRFELLALFFLALGVSAGVQAIDIIAFNKAELAKHNEYRRLSGVPPLTYSSILAAIAQKYAELMVKTNNFQHSGAVNIGENLYSCTVTPNGECLVPGAATEAWYSEIEEYDFGSPGFNPRTGHYTQVVWKATTMVGCGYASTPTSKNNTFISYVVCNYSPPGNYVNDFSGNVLRPNE